MQLITLGPFYQTSHEGRDAETDGPLSMEPARAAAVAAEAQSARAAELLDTLSSLPGVSHVNAKSMKPFSVPNHFGVSYRLRLP